MKLLLLIIVGCIIIGYSLLCWKDKFNPFNWKEQKIDKKENKIK